MASQKIKRALFQILIICLGFGCASSSNEIAYCPKVGVISDLDRVSEIEVAGNQSKSNILLSSKIQQLRTCLLYTSPSPRDVEEARMPSSA